MDRLSLPKDKIRVLLLEGVNDSAVDSSPAPATPTSRACRRRSTQALRQALRGVHLLGIRSRTQLTPRSLRPPTA